MDVKIVLVAEWDGWCGRCAAERPLVLTRTGRRTLRSWLAGVDDDERPLTLTCRLCGVGVLVPREEDDPEVVLEPDDADPLTDSRGRSTDSAATGAAPAVVGPPVDDVTAASSPAPELAASPPQLEELQAARRAVGGALQALLTQRVGQAASPAGVPVPYPATFAAPFGAPPLPQQRSEELAAPVDGLAALQLLADGLDLLSPSHH